MKKIGIMFWLLMITLAEVGMVKMVVANDLAVNQVYVELSHGKWHGTSADTISNVPIEWDHQWFMNFINKPGESGLSVENPIVELSSSLGLIRFHPDDPSVFTAHPETGVYTWNFEDLEMVESAHLPLSAWEDGVLIEKPRFSASRSVYPEILTELVTLQTVTIDFTLEELLPVEINHVLIVIGSPIIAYEEYRLVKGRFISQIDLEGWEEWTNGIEAYWSTTPENVEVGQTYQFQAILESTKTSELLGSPVFKPSGRLGYNQWIHPGQTIGNSVTIVYSDEIQATFSGISPNEIQWDPAIGIQRYDLILNPIVSRVIDIPPPGPPFHVLIPATVDIDPNTLNLKSKGEWITCYIELPEGYDVNDIDVSTVMLNGEVPAEPKPTEVGDYDNDGIPDLMVKFNRSSVQDILEPGDEVEITVTGELTDRTLFEGSDTIRVIEDGTAKATVVQEITQAKFGLSQNYPNPFNPETTIEYDIEKDCDVTLKIYNLAGQLVKTLVDEGQTAGHYTIIWHGDTDGGGEVASGVYFYRIKAGDKAAIKKMVVLK